MKVYARIQSGVVAELFETAGDITRMFHPDLVWVECDATVKQGWLYAGGAFSEPPAPPAPPPPQSVTMRQARQALLLAGLLDDVNTAIASLPSPDKEMATIEWEYSQTVERNRPFVLLLGPALGLDEAALDALFVTASTL